MFYLKETVADLRTTAGRWAAWLCYMLVAGATVLGQQTPAITDSPQVYTSGQHARLRVGAPLDSTVGTTQPIPIMGSETDSREAGAEIQAGGDLLFPQFGSGGGLSSLFVLYNLDDRSSTVDIEIRDDFGLLQTVLLADNGNCCLNPISTGRWRVQLAPLEIRFLETPSTGPVTVGSARITSGSIQELDATLLFNVNFGLSGSAGVGSSPPMARGFATPWVQDNSVNLRTGIALMNAESGGSTVRLSLLSQGEVVATAEVPLAGRGHLARFVDEFNWIPPVNFNSRPSSGLLVVEGSRPIAAIALRSAGSFLTTLPVTPLSPQFVVPGNIFTIVVENKLLNQIIVTANGRVLGSVPPQSSAQEELTGNSLDLSWDLTRSTTTEGDPIGDLLGGVFEMIDNPSGTISFTVNNRFANNEAIFLPQIDNETSTDLLMAVNWDLSRENRCFCVVRGNSTVRIGYYHLHSNSNVYAFRTGSNYTGSAIFWEDFLDFVQDDTGLTFLRATFPP